MNAVTTTTDFSLAKKAVADQFAMMQKHSVFRTEATAEDMWALYLASFPPGTNPIFRSRTEHDCACCRHFIRDVGNAVIVIDDKIVTLWDRPTGDPAYDAVFTKLAAFVRSRPIKEPFLHYERTAGTNKNHELKDGVFRTWDHFYVPIAPAFVVPKASLASVLGAKKSTYAVLERALTELSVEALDQFLELTAQNSLYRGTEFAPLVQKFKLLKLAYIAKSTKHARSLFVWQAVQNESTALCHIRNSAVGTLLVNLSEGMDLEAAVRAYETVVAPQNYKRPTALVTKAMIERAKADIEALGLTTALQRRHAVLSDISINNVLFADRSAKKLMHDVFDEVAATSVKTGRTTSVVEEVPVARFVSEVLPKIDSIEVLLENRHAPNFVSLIAPSDPNAGLLFKWPNPFSWSYAGEVTDSIKERVKQAGGNVTGDLCCRLAWYNFDDLDFHMKEPGGDHIYFATRSRRSTGGGMLDVDMNAGSGRTRTPVENIFYASKNTMKEGEYTLSVHQFSNRDKKDPGFEVEIDWLGEVFTFASTTSPRQDENVIIARMHYSKKEGLKFLTAMNSKHASRTVWNLATGTFHRVNVIMRSPNYWDGCTVGNEHLFFMLDGCVSDEQARGFYNEFLMPTVAEHRKVLELVGSKTKPVPASEQLSGLGFSSTKHTDLVCRVKGSFTRTIKIVF